MKPHALLLLALLAGVSRAQFEFLSNGDFAAGLAGWTGSGNGGSPGLAAFDTSGCGSSQAFGMQPGTLTPTNYVPYSLRQQILALPNLPLELHLDACLAGPAFNNQGGYLKFTIGGVVVADWPEFSGTFTAGSYRRHLVFRFTQKLSGQQDFAVQLWREKYAWSQTTPWLYVDNIRLTTALPPLLSFPGDRRLGGTLNLALEGTPGNAGLILAAALPAPGPIPIPGFTGGLQLAPFGFHFLAFGTIDSAGFLRAALSIPNDPALGGVPLHWQGLEVGPLATGGFSHLHRVCVHP